jgi:hypothetical protein
MNGKDSQNTSEDINDILKGAKLQFGNKLVDPQDRRIRHPHSRVIFDRNAGSSSSNTLLHTDGHRPSVNVVHTTDKTTTTTATNPNDESGNINIDKNATSTSTP